jgi:uncharacterized protein (DUF2249 family)
MQQMQELPEGCILEVELGFDPSALLDGLSERGARARPARIARRRWMLLIQPPGDDELMDLRDLEAPIPMEQILEAAAELPPGATLIARTPCYPRPLMAQLDRRQLDWEAAEAADASGLIWIARPA